MLEPYEQPDFTEKWARHALTRAGSGKSSSTTHDDPDGIEEASIQDPDKTKSITAAASTRQSQDLKRTASNILTKVASRLTTHSIVNPPPPPDGGVKAWTQVGMGMCMVFCTWGWINSYGAFQSYYTLNLGVAPSTVSWIGSVQNFLTLFVGVFSGRALDAGYYLPILMVGSTVQVLGIFLMR